MVTKSEFFGPRSISTGFLYGDLPVKQTGLYIWGEFTDSLANTESELARRFDEIVGTENRDLIDARGNFVNQLEKYIRNLHENGNENRERNFAAVNETYLILNRQREIFRSKLDVTQLDSIKDFSHQQYHSLITSMNAISIVFDCKERFIFLGDAPESVVNYLSSSLDEKYKFVKIQHHGTEKYFTYKMPNGSYNLISNGGYEWRKVSNKFIGHGKVICTKAHNDPQRFCKYYAYNGICSSNCIKVKLDCQIQV